jgi:hypothetical protein
MRIVEITLPDGLISTANDQKLSERIKTDSTHSVTYVVIIPARGNQDLHCRVCQSPRDRF